MKRIKLSDDELAIIEGLRHEKAIWNSALEEALRVLREATSDRDLDSFNSADHAAAEIMKLRRL